MNSFQFKSNDFIDLNRIKIIAPQISLVSLNQSFANQIYREFNEKITLYMVPEPPQNINETHTFIENSIEGMKNQKELVLAIINDQEEFLGCCGLHGRDKWNTPELGIWLKQDAQGKKYGQMAINALFKWASKNIIFEYLIYPVDKENSASRKIPESLGGIIYSEAKVKTHSGNILDEVIYKIEA